MDLEHKTYNMKPIKKNRYWNIGVGMNDQTISKKLFKLKSEVGKLTCYYTKINFRVI